MTLRSLTAALGAAALSFAALAGAPAQAAEPGTSPAPAADVAQCGRFVDGLTADQMTAGPANTTVLTTQAGYTVTVTAISYALPEGYRCDLAYAASPDAAAKRVAFAFSGTRSQTSLVQVDGQEPYTYDSTSGQFQNLRLTWGPGQDRLYFASAVYPPSRSGVIGQTPYSPTGPDGAHWTETTAPTTWTADVTVIRTTARTVPASTEAVAQAAQKRDVAVAAAKAAYAKKVAIAKQARDKALKQARTNKAKVAARALYAARVAAATKVRAAALKSAEAAYDAAIVRVVWDLEYTSEVLPTSGSVPA